MIAPHRRSALLSKYTSRCNKIALCAGWRVEWRWSGQQFNSRIEVLLDDEWTTTKSYEDDIRPKLFRRDHYGESTVVYLVANRSLADDAAARALLAQQASALREIAGFIETKCLAEAPLEPAS